MPDTPRQTRNAEVNFRGEKRSNATHASVTDPDARLYKKAPGAAATLCFMGHTLMENRNGLVVQADLTHADGHGERKAALEMINRHSPGSTRRLTLGADKGYDSADFVAALRRMVVTPHRTEGPAFRHRRTNHAPSRLRPVPAAPEEDRGTLRLGQDRGRHGPDRSPRPRQGPRAVHDDHGGLQPRKIAEALGSLTTAATPIRVRPPMSRPPTTADGTTSFQPTSSAAC